MSRDPYQLKVFRMADTLALDIYRETAHFPLAERFALQNQVRRASTSIAINIVEGCARRSTREFLRFLDVAMGSASEARYLVSLATRLGYIPSSNARQLGLRFNELIRTLQGLINSVARLVDSSESRTEDRGLRTED